MGVISMMSSLFLDDYTQGQEQERSLELEKSLKKMAKFLFKERKSYISTLDSLERRLLNIKNLPSWVGDDFNMSLAQIEDFKKAIKYERFPNDFAKETDKTGRTAKIVESSKSIASSGDSAAMSLATVIGTATTVGLLDTMYSGADATNAALEWLSGTLKNSKSLVKLGILGGGLVAAFAAFGLAGEVSRKQDEIERTKELNKMLESKQICLSNLIKRSRKNYESRVLKSFEWLKNIRSNDYSEWNNSDKRELEKLVNAVSNMVQLINERV